MSCRVEEDPDIILGLKISERCASRCGVCPGALQIVDAYFQVHHHLLVSGARGPGRSHIGRFGLERQPHAAVGCFEQDPVRFLSLDLPAK